MCFEMLGVVGTIVPCPTTFAAGRRPGLLAPACTQGTYLVFCRGEKRHADAGPPAAPRPAAFHGERRRPRTGRASTSCSPPSTAAMPAQRPPNIHTDTLNHQCHRPGARVSLDFALFLTRVVLRGPSERGPMSEACAREPIQRSGRGLLHAMSPWPRRRYLRL